MTSSAIPTFGTRGLAPIEEHRNPTIRNILLVLSSYPIPVVGMISMERPLGAWEQVVAGRSHQGAWYGANAPASPYLAQWRWTVDGGPPDVAVVRDAGRGRPGISRRRRYPREIGVYDRDCTTMVWARLYFRWVSAETGPRAMS